MSAPIDIRLSSTRIGENKSGVLVGTLGWTDRDRGDTPTYTVSDDRFEVIGNKLWLKSGNPFDYETTPSVDLTITVTDSTGNAYAEDFTLAIVNANEAPTDIAISGNRVYENKAGANIGRLTATDQDANERFTYSITDSRFELVNNLLKLKDGVSLDFERTPIVHIAVTVTDRAGASYREVLTLNVIDRDEAPTDIGLTGNKVAENKAGAIIGTLSTVDPDKGDTATYTVSDDRFEVVGNQLKLKAGISLDHEAEDSLVLTVTSTDSGGLSYSEKFTLLVQDVNEKPSAPSLDNLTFAANTPGAVVGHLSATDPDTGDTISYRLGNGNFEVVDGVLKLKDGVSLSGTADIDLRIAAVDQDGLATSQVFTLHPLQTNHAPTAIGLTTNTVSENVGGATIGRLTVTDPDVGDRFTFAVDDDRFVVKNGVLSLAPNASLDYEATPTVTIGVTATDQGGLSYSQDLTINVRDVNEAPVVVHPFPDFNFVVGTHYVLDDNYFSNLDIVDDINYYFRDPEGGELSVDDDGTVVSVSGDFDWLTYDPRTDTVSGTPQQDDIGDRLVVRLVVRDPQGLALYEDVAFQVVARGGAAALAVTSVTETSTTGTEHHLFG
ncbi:hypothetical protein IAI18_15000 [Acetobacteraceae bacterium H6797]|nr:hypothetical protein [Acetobacteraceae bacterium H6797]